MNENEAKCIPLNDLVKHSRSRDACITEIVTVSWDIFDSFSDTSRTGSIVVFQAFIEEKAWTDYRCKSDFSLLMA